MKIIRDCFILFVSNKEIYVEKYYMRRKVKGKMILRIKRRGLISSYDVFGICCIKLGNLSKVIEFRRSIFNS